MTDWYEWGYRRSHIIQNAAGAGTGYQVRIHVYKSGTSASGDEVHLSSLCRDDFGDIRFTGSDGITQLPYWMESKTDEADAIFWVKVAEALSTENRTIYLYYGNPDATTVSNGADTFVYFDDFTGGGISEDLTLYVEDNDHAWFDFDSEDGIDMLVGNRDNSSGQWHEALAHYPQVNYGHAIRTRCKRVVQGAGGNTIYVAAFLGDLDFPHSNCVGAISYCKNDSTADRIGYRFCNDGTCSAGYPGDRELDTWQIIESRWDNDYVELLLDETSLAYNDNTNYIPDGARYPAIGIEAGSDYGTNKKYFDWVLVRKFVEHEPFPYAWWPAEEKP